MRNLETVNVYVDVSDRNNVGLAFRAEFSDGHCESGPVDGGQDDIEHELVALVAQYEGNVGAGSIIHHDREGGGMMWRAN